MNKLAALALFGTLIMSSTSANAWFFFFLPGSVTGKISDAFTGAEGENCVGPNAKVGDTVRLPNGSMMTIKSLSGTSSRCTTEALPIRALLEPSTAIPPPIDVAKQEEAKWKVAKEEAKRWEAEDEARRIAAAEDAKRIASEEQAKRISAEEEMQRTKAEAANRTGTPPPSALLTVATTHQVDFNAEATKAARILGCQPSDLKVTGVEGANIQYVVACEDSKMLSLSCDPSGLCLQKKPETRSKR